MGVVFWLCCCNHTCVQWLPLTQLNGNTYKDIKQEPLNHVPKKISLIFSHMFLVITFLLHWLITFFSCSGWFQLHTRIEHESRSGPWVHTLGLSWGEYFVTYQHGLVQIHLPGQSCICNGSLKATWAPSRTHSQQLRAMQGGCYVGPSHRFQEIAVYCWLFYIHLPWCKLINRPSVMNFLDPSCFLFWCILSSEQSKFMSLVWNVPHKFGSSLPFFLSFWDKLIDLTDLNSATGSIHKICFWWFSTKLLNFSSDMEVGSGLFKVEKILINWNHQPISHSCIPFRMLLFVHVWNVLHYMYNHSPCGRVELSSIVH